MPITYYTKTGQPYIKLKNGRAKFIKRSSAPKFRARTASKKTAKRRIRPTTRRRVSYMPKKKKRTSKGRNSFSKYSLPIGAGVYAVAEPILDSVLAGTGFGAYADLIKLAGGLMFMKKGGITGGVAKSAVVIGVNDLVKNLMSGSFSLPFMSNGQSAAAYY